MQAKLPRQNLISFLCRWRSIVRRNVVVSWIFLSSLFALGCSSVPAENHCHVWKSGRAYDKAISDLDQWAADNFADAPNARLSSANIEKFELDIDHDGAPEIFITTPHLQGNGGGPHLVFKKRGQFFFYLGQLPGRKETMQVLPMRADGYPRVLTFSAGGRTGTACVWKGDGKKFVIEMSEEIESGDSGTEEGRRRFAELFGRP